MRHSRGFVFVAAALLAGPAAAAAQVFVVSPAAGSESSYRRTVLRWVPIPGVSEYHLEVDDDPAFRSPEVDVIVSQPFYRLSGETLRLNGQLSWPAYVRINGMRWSSPVFSPGYVTGALWPEVAVGDDGRVFYGYLGGKSGDAFAAVRTSDDFSSEQRLSPPDTDGNPHGIALGVDSGGVAHAFWTEQVSGLAGLPFYANAIDWTPSALGAPVLGAADVGPSMVLSGSRIDIVDEAFGPLHWFTSGDSGGSFTRSTVPFSSHTISAQATAAGPDGILIVAERLEAGGKPLVLQRSANGWTPEIIGTGRWPSAAVGAGGVVHVLAREALTGAVSYSNSARAFGTWTPLPIDPVFGQQLLPIVVDDARHRIYAAAPDPLGINLCAAMTAGESWTCRVVGGAEANYPDLKIDSTGVLHVAWRDVQGGGYATSLGSFLASNVPPDATLGRPIPWPNTAIVPSFTGDSDGDAVSGFVAVGVSERRRRRLLEGDSLQILGHEVFVGHTALGAADAELLFRAPGTDWRTLVTKADLVLPATIAVKTIEGRLVDSFTILAWEPFAVTIDHLEFAEQVRKPFSGATLPSVDLSGVAAGLVTVRIVATDGASVRAFDAPLFRTPGQTHLTMVDFRPAVDGFLGVLAGMPAGHFSLPALRNVLGSEMNAVAFTIERALITLDSTLRPQLLNTAATILRDRVVSRIDGCARGGQPDASDWVIDCGGQARLGVQAGALVRAIDALR